MNGIPIIDLGIKDYGEVYRFQKELVAAQEEAVILVEHPAVYTSGRKGEMPAELPHPRFEIERGGEVTFHNPGQIVCYPILKLEGRDQDLHLHLRRLESLIIAVINDFGISGGTKAGATGVWAGEFKIASIGIAVSKWMTYHGVALNVNNDLSGFFAVSPSGFSAEVMTSTEKVLGSKIDIQKVKESLIRSFETIFRRSLSLRPDKPT